jgi:RNA polymerase sigma-70 factor (ECF subfamily)
MSIRNHLPLDEDLVDESGVVDQKVEHKLTSDLLKSALDKLNDTQRDVIILRFVNNLTIAQVAQTLHKSQDSIKALQRRALSALRDILKEWEVVYGYD